MTEILIRNARLAFADTVFEKKGIAGDSSSKPSYGCSLILPPNHPQIAELEKLEKQLAEDHKWKKDASAAEVLKAAKRKGRSVVKDGDDKAKYEGFPGNYYVSAKSDTRPTAINKDRSPVTKDDGVIYSGCYVNARISLWVQDNQWGQYINCELTGVQFVKDGDAFSGGAGPANPDDFPDLDAGGDASDDNMFD